ncbi:MAG: serine/threonine protein kinase [Acidobacteria bacterium]|nr:serine/threonine protein kinase [Acidobacteriota bacterium]MCB9398084.1 serine/threonine protein kinase [Acidobacteriota bacterium]
MIGTSFAGFKVLERLGGGNTGVVYRAFDPSGNRVVALKVLANDLLFSEEKKARFLRESQAAVLLDHPSIAKLYHMGEYHQCHYFAIEYIEGQCFRELIESHPNGLPLERFFEILPPILEGMAYAHSLGLVHRDLKPENLKIDKQGQPKILDFGLVKFLDDDSKENEGFKTMTGMVLGSARYMSPEQADGLLLDTRTDVFSLGIIMYEMLSGKNPFHAKSPFATMQRILRDDPISVELVRTDTSRKLSALVERCLQKDRTKRFADASDLLQAFNALSG